MQQGQLLLERGAYLREVTAFLPGALQGVFEKKTLHMRNHSHFCQGMADLMIAGASGQQEGVEPGSMRLDLRQQCTICTLPGVKLHTFACQLLQARLQASPLKGDFFGWCWHYHLLHYFYPLFND
jgi:hypothetical protein